MVESIGKSSFDIVRIIISVYVSFRTTIEGQGSGHSKDSPPYDGAESGAANNGNGGKGATQAMQRRGVKGGIYFPEYPELQL